MAQKWKEGYIDWNKDSEATFIFIYIYGNIREDWGSGLNKKWETGKELVLEKVLTMEEKLLHGEG